MGVSSQALMAEAPYCYWFEGYLRSTVETGHT